MSSAPINFDQINRAAQARLLLLLQKWIPGGRIESGEYVGRNPTRNDRHPGSFKVNLRSGVWSDFATGDAGGDPVSLFAYLNRLNQLEAGRSLARELGLEPPSLAPINDNGGCTLAQYADLKGLPVDFLQDLGLADCKYGWLPAITIPYRDTEGTERAIRYRTALRKAGVDQRFKWKKGSTPFLYGLWRLRPSERVVIVEGESDCHTLWFHGINAVGLPGVGSWKEERDAAVFADCPEISVVIEPDQGGETARKWLAKSKIRHRARLVSLGEHKDPSALHVADPSAFKDQFQAAIAKAKPWSEKDSPNDKKQKDKAVTLGDIIKMILEEFYDDAGLFCTPDGTVYAHARAQNHRETWPILSRGFRRWLNNWVYQRYERVPKSEDLKEIIAVLEARACASGSVRPVFMRVAEHDGNIYVDLADRAWRAVEITPDGWRVIDAPPVRFRRAAGMRPLPVPERGGSIDLLRRFLNVGSDNDFRLAVAWVLAALSGRGPYPVLALAGEQGSAKSTAAAVLRALTDPNSAPIRSLPREERDLFIAATNSHVLAFDNVSGLPSWLSDALCRLSTGGGWACRQLYTDNDEVLFDGTRPAVLNGIEDFISRPDLADRALFLTLTAIPEERRMPERTFWLAFERERSRILGALFDMVAHGLRELPKIHLESLPRLADFALWITACEGVAWKRGAFLEAFEANRRGLVDTVLEADPVASAVRALMTTRDRWVGTASGLLGALAEHVDDATRRGKAWPATPRALSARLR